MDRKHRLRRFHIERVKADIGAGMGLLMKHGAHRAIAQHRPALSQSLAEWQLGHSAGLLGLIRPAV